MYLSQLSVNPRSREARRDLTDRYELHRTISKGFPSEYPSNERVLYRVESSQYDMSSIKILVQSQLCPDWSEIARTGSYLLDAPRSRKVAVRVNDGQRLPFRLQVNPTRKHHNKRYAILDDRSLIEWLQRKGQNHGFSAGELDVQIAKLGKMYGKNGNQTWYAVQFDGVLTVTDADSFSRAIQSGIGSAKGFGFGLLSIPYPT